MDDFVVNKLQEWNLREWIHRFKDQDIDKESLYSLGDQDINDLIPKVGPRVRFKKRLTELKNEDDFLTELFPVTNGGEQGKRKLDFQGESSGEQPKAKRLRGITSTSFSEETILSDVKKIMANVYAKLRPNTKLTNFLKKKICKLQTETRELVGVFGRTGAGKSSLINAVIEKNKLLPSGEIEACTSVMIKVEANMHSQKYEAEIEFIEKEEWKDEVWSMLQFLQNYKNPEEHSDGEDCDDDDYKDELTEEVQEYENKLSALYGKEWMQKTFEKLIDNKYFKEVPEFLKSGTKTLICESREMLSEEITKYTRNENDVAKRVYWPLVKCVTVRVPNNKLLQHVTLMDLPGNGDRNKSRDKMWKKIVGSCSTVWIVADITRPADEHESWEILKTALSLLGNGGECQRLHFICTKCDQYQDFETHSEDDRQKRMIERNKKSKDTIKEKFNRLTDVKKHFSEDCFEVFTVSSMEFLTGTHPENSEIPDLQKFLQNLNDCHSESLNYVTGARGILSLMKGARAMTGINEKVYEEVDKNKSCQLDLVKKEMEKIYSAFEKCLTKGVVTSQNSYEKALKNTIYARGNARNGFHRVLNSLVQNGGIAKSKKTGKETNLNMKLSSFLTQCIDEEFRKTFPNEGKHGPFNGVIQKFSLNTENLKQEYKDVELQLIFLKTEEERMKTGLSKMIRDQKKEIYHSLTETIEEAMKECYQKAAQFEGPGMQKNQRETIEQHVYESKDTMFEMAKGVMLAKLRSLMEDIVETVENTMDDSIELSLKNKDHFIPDVSRDLHRVEAFYNELKNGSNKDLSNKSCTEPMRQESPVMIRTEAPTLQD